MKTWGAAINDLSWINLYPDKPVGLAGRGVVGGSLSAVGLVIPPRACEEHGPQDRFLPKTPGHINVGIVSDRAFVERQARQERRESFRGDSRQ
jgi:hypothetical protein